MAAKLDPVVLTGEHVVLEPLAPTHGAQLAAVCEAAELGMFSYTCLVPAIDDSGAAYVEEAHAGWNAGRYLPFAVRDRGSGDLLGCTRFGDIDLPSRRAEIGWTWYVASARGTVVNPECKLLLLTHAFETLGMQRVMLKTSGFNERSQRAIAKLGAVHEGVMRRHVMQRDGRVRDTVMYSILDDEWPEVRAGLEQRLGRPTSVG